jgi:hypothetical protein
MTMRKLDPLPYDGVVPFSRQVNAAGSWGAGGLPIADERFRSLDYLDASMTGRTLLFVDYGGTLIWGGMLWIRRSKKSEKRIVVSGSEMHSYYARRLQAKDYSTYWEPGGAKGETSPLEIVAKIFEDAKEREHEITKSIIGTGLYIAGGITVQINYSEGFAAAPPITASYPGNQLQAIDSIFSTLSQMGYGAGFDYSYDAQYKPGTKTPEIVLNLWFPRMGRKNSGIAILDRSLLDSEDSEDSTVQANSIFVTGSGSGGVAPDEALAENVIAAGYPLLEEMISHTQVNNEAVLQGVSFGALGVKAWPVSTPTLELPLPLPSPKTGVINPNQLTFGDFNLGDNAVRRIPPNRDYRWPNGMDFAFRINGWEVANDEKGVPILKLMMAPPPVGEFPGPMPPR